MTPKNSSFDSASRVKFESGSETSGLKHIEKSALISPRWIASMISTAVMPAPGILSSGHAPHRRNVAARVRIGDRARAGQLIAFLAVLAAALAVALPGDHHAARSLAAEVAGRQEQIQHREAVLDPLRMVLDPARVEPHRAVRFTDPVRRLVDVVAAGRR